MEWEHGGKRYEVALWDTAGQETLSALRAVAYPETDVFLLGYDMTSRMTLDNVSSWVDEIHENWSDYQGIVLVGTKYDLWLEKQEDGDTDELVEMDDVDEVAAEIDAAHQICTSARTGYGLPDVGDLQYFDEDREEGPDLSELIMEVFQMGQRKSKPEPELEPSAEDEGSQAGWFEGKAHRERRWFRGSADRKATVGTGIDQADDGWFEGKVQSEDGSTLRRKRVWFQGDGPGQSTGEAVVVEPVESDEEASSDDDSIVRPIKVVIVGDGAIGKVCCLGASGAEQCVCLACRAAC